MEVRDVDLLVHALGVPDFSSGMKAGTSIGGSEAIGGLLEHATTGDGVGGGRDLSLWEEGLDRAVWKDHVDKEW